MAGAYEVDPNGPYPTVSALLASNVITATSTGVVALPADSSENINFSGYPGLGLGAAVPNVNYSGTVTPCDDTDFFGGGPGTLTVLDGANCRQRDHRRKHGLHRGPDCSGNLTVNGQLGLAAGTNSVGGLTGYGVVQPGGDDATIEIGNDGGSSTFDGTLQNGIAGTFSVVVTSDSTFVMAGTNTISGPTTVAEGATFQADSTTATSPNSALNVLGTVILNCSSATAGPLTGDGTAEGGNGPANFTIVAAGTLFYGTMADGSGGPLSLEVGGTGTATLGCDNTSTGGLTIDQAVTVVVAGATALGDGDVTVNGTLNLGTYNTAVTGVSGRRLGAGQRHAQHWQQRELVRVRRRLPGRQRRKPVGLRHRRLHGHFRRKQHAVGRHDHRRRGIRRGRVEHGAERELGVHRQRHV